MTNDNAARRRGMSIASALGYKIAEQTYVPAQDLREGDNVIVFTEKGEPIMSGPIAKIDKYGSDGTIVVGDQSYNFQQYRFRHM